MSSGPVRRWPRRSPGPRVGRLRQRCDVFVPSSPFPSRDWASAGPAGTDLVGGPPSRSPRVLADRMFRGARRPGGRSGAQPGCDRPCRRRRRTGYFRAPRGGTAWGTRVTSRRQDRVVVTIEPAVGRAWPRRSPYAPRRAGHRWRPCRHGRRLQRPRRPRWPRASRGRGWAWARAGSSGPIATLSSEGRWLTDAAGRVVVLHGVNEVAKSAPYPRRPSASGPSMPSS